MALQRPEVSVRETGRKDPIRSYIKFHRQVYLHRTQGKSALQMLQLLHRLQYSYLSLLLQ